MIQKGIQIDLFQCDFCGSFFVDEKTAKENGCMEEMQPKMKFKIGDIVLAELVIGAGMEAVGRATVLCEIKEIKKPSIVEDLTVAPIRFGGYNNQYVGFRVPLLQHDWLVRVCPLDKWHNEQKTEYFVEGWVAMKSLKAT